jgi:hypothetical protein
MTALTLLEGPSSSAAADGIANIGAGGVLRGGLAPWQARRVAAHIDANLAGPIRIKDLATLRIQLRHERSVAFHACLSPHRR